MAVESNCLSLSFHFLFLYSFSPPFFFHLLTHHITHADDGKRQTDSLLPHLSLSPFQLGESHGTIDLFPSSRTFPFIVLVLELNHHTYTLYTGKKGGGKGIKERKEREKEMLAVIT